MGEVKVLESAEEFEHYRELIRYCFSDEFSQKAPIFSFLSDEDRVYGLYEQDKLESGIISRSFDAHLWGEQIKLNGITYVASAPEVRNKGHIRLLMNKILKDAYHEGYAASALYPFLFRFYAKFGYGTAGPVFRYRFSPEDIRKDLVSHIAGSFEPLNSGRENLEKSEKIELFSQRFAAAKQITDSWAENYSFGIDLSFSPEQMRRYLGTQNEQAYIYRNGEGEAVAFIQYKMVPQGEDSYRLEIQRFAYLSAEGLQALMGFLSRHRNQCPKITLYAPSDLPLQELMQEPRIEVSQLSEWMVRPLDAAQLLRMKVRQNSFKGTVRFSLQDPVIEENTATYTIHAGEVSTTGFNGENEIPFELFSSLLSGAYSWKQLSLVGKLPASSDGLITPDVEESLEIFFQPGPPVMVSESF